MTSQQHHEKFPPSSFPHMAKCGHYKSAPAGDAAHRGQLQHEALAASLNGAAATDAMNALASEEKQAVEWAAAAVNDFFGADRKVERRLNLMNDDFDIVTFGTADVVGVADAPRGKELRLFDYKSGNIRDYRHQMAAYALMAMQEFSLASCKVIIAYGRARHVEKYRISFREAQAMVDEVIAMARAAEAGQIAPAMGDYCAWCCKAGECRATRGVIEHIPRHYDPAAPAAQIDAKAISTFHASRITNPIEASHVLTIARFMAKWADAAKAHITQKALEGMEIPGYALKPGASRRVLVDDINAVYAASGLDCREFLACCAVKIGDLDMAIARNAGHKTASGKGAKEEIARRLAEVCAIKEIAPALAPI